MQQTQMPANIRLLNTSKANMDILPTVTSLDSFDGGNSYSHHPDGLFSERIFGRPGSKERDTKFGKIELGLPIIHPLLLKKLQRLKGLYKEIIFSKAFARFDTKEKDFVAADPLTGDTGFAFFLEHLPNIVLKETESEKRSANIELIRKAISEGTYLLHAIPVIPAGLRDIYVDENGRTSEDEVNSRYRSLIAASNTIPKGADPTSPSFNTSRITLQNAYNAVYDYLWNLYNGKNGFALDRFYSRAIFNGTRNVMTAIDNVAEYLGAPNSPKPNNIVVGLYQTLKGVLPVSQHLFLTGWMNHVFNEGGGNARVVDRKTRKSVVIPIERKVYDLFRTPDGVNKLINLYFTRERRHSPVMIGEHYAGLTYLGKIGDKLTFKIFGDIEDLPKDCSPEDCHPTTWVEMFYIMGYREFHKYPVSNTRYPVAGLGSTFTSFTYVKTTTTGDRRYELDDDWKIKTFSDGNPVDSAYEFPRGNISKFFETASVSGTRMAGLTLDFDGDMMSQIFLYTVESIKENQDMMQTAAFYINPRGGLLNSVLSVESSQRVLQGLASR